MCQAAPAFAPDDDIAIALLGEPSDSVFGGDAAARDDESADGGEGSEHFRQRVVFVDVPGKHFRTAHEASGVDHDAESKPEAVVALLFRVSALRALGRSAAAPRAR